ncbi:hypothetical protein C0J52_09048 [Blattella germanica]|nr:hypothetical protein C0J52_09048 [Blattella germanica]
MLCFSSCDCIISLFNCVVSSSRILRTYCMCPELSQSNSWKMVPRKIFFFARATLALAFEDSRRSKGCHAKAVPYEKDHILRKLLGV